MKLGTECKMSHRGMDIWICVCVCGRGGGGAEVACCNDR